MAIATPEGVDLELPLAGLGSRFAAAMVDGALKSLLLLAVFGASVGIASLAGAEGIGLALFFASTLLVMFGYDVLFETLGGGRTPAKRWLHLRVVRTGGQPVGFRSSAIRNLMRIVDGPGTGWIAGIVSILASKRNQRLGDMVAGTLVIRDLHAPAAVPAPWSERTKPQAAPAGAWAAPSGARESAFDAHWDSGWDVSAVTPEELAAVRQFLDRRWSLQLAARNDIGHRLADGLRAKVVGAPKNLRGEQFLEELATIKSSRS